MAPAPVMAILLSAVLGCTQPAENATVAEDRLNTDIAAQLPKGTSASVVETWLASRQLEHSGLIDNAKLAHMGADPATFELKAISRSATGKSLVRTDTQLTFTFDRERRLIAARVEPVHTGL